MSGGGGGGDYGSGLPGGPCDRLSVETAIQSPNPATIQRLSLGQVLDVRSENRTAYVYLADEVVGTLIFTGLPRLLDCLDQGYPFVADVIQLSGPDCLVKVRPQ